MQQRLNKCNVIMHVVPIRATTPFANVIIRLDRLQQGHSPRRAKTGSSRELDIFHLKIPILTSQCPNLILKVV